MSEGWEIVYVRGLLREWQVVPAPGEGEGEQINQQLLEISVLELVAAEKAAEAVDLLLEAA